MSDFENAVSESLGRIEQKIDQHISSTGETLRDHEKRLRTVEATRNRLLGTAATVGAAFSGLVDWLFRHGGAR